MLALPERALQRFVVSQPTASAGRTQPLNLVRRRRFQIVKATVAFFCLAALMFMGLRGKQQARRQAVLDDIKAVRDQLQQKLDDEPGSTTNASRSGSSGAQMQPLLGLLDSKLKQFDADYDAKALSRIEDMELRLGWATLANAGQRFSDALRIVTDQDEQGNRDRSQAQIDRLIRIRQIRGDSFYGLHQWQSALERYREVLGLRPNTIVALGRVAECHVALGHTNEAVAAYEKLAWSHNHRGDALLIQGNLDSAIGHYEKSIAIRTRLIEAGGRNELGHELGITHNHCGDAFLILGKLDSAVGQYQKAVELQRRFLQPDDRGELANELAISLHNLGNAFLAQAKTDAALEEYDKAIKLQVPLVDQNGPRESANESANELAKSYNNRGVARRVQGNVPAGLADFENAIRLLTKLQEGSGVSGSATTRTNRSSVQVDVAMSYSEKGLDALMRTRFAEQNGRTDLAVLCATSFKNRGYAYLAQDQTAAAIADFKEAMGIYRKLVDEEGQRDLTLQLAEALSPLAWIYATNPDSPLRDGRVAKDYARRACELSEWKAFRPVEILAAAYAETGHPAEAIQWQEKALQLAPRKYAAEVRSRLELYKSGQPYRSPASK